MEDEEQTPPRCHDCGKSAPRTETNFTLISARHGWRITFRKVDGLRLAEWRCADCWALSRGNAEGS